MYITSALSPLYLSQMFHSCLLIRKTDFQRSRVAKREKWAERSFTCWFNTQMTTIATAGQGWSKELHSDSSVGAGPPRTLAIFHHYPRNTSWEWNQVRSNRNLNSTHKECCSRGYKEVSILKCNALDFSDVSVSISLTKDQGTV